MAFKVPVARPEIQPGSPVSAQQNINAPAEAFGGGSALNGLKGAQSLGAAAQNIGQGLVNYAALAREQEDKALVNDRLAQAQNYLNDVLYDPETGLMTKQNRDALGGGKLFAESTRKAREQYTSGMTERQKRLFEEKYRTAEAAGVRTVSIHEATQRRQYMNSSAEAAIASDIRAAYNVPFDPDSRDAFVGEANKALDELAKDNGWDGKILKSKREKMMGQYYTGVFARMVDLDPSAARAYYKQVGTQIPGDVKQKIKDMLDKGELLAFGQQFTDRMYAKHPDNIAAMYKEARSIKDADKREQALSALDKRIARDAKVKTQVKQQTWDSAVDYAAKGKPVPMEIYASLSSTQQKQLDKLTDYAVNGREPITVRSVKTTADLLNDDQLKQMSMSDVITKFRPYMDDTDYASLASRWRTANKKGTEKDISETNFKEILNFKLRDAGLIPRVETRAHWSEDEAATFDNVEHEVRDRIKASGDYSRENMNKITDDVLNEKITMGGFFGNDTKLLVNAKPEDMENAVAVVPTGETRKRIIRTGDGRSVEVDEPITKEVKLNTAGPDKVTIEWLAGQGGSATMARQGQAILIRDEWAKAYPGVPMVVTDANGPAWVDTSQPGNKGKTNPNERTLYGIVRKVFGADAPLQAYLLTIQNLKKRRSHR